MNVKNFLCQQYHKTFLIKKIYIKIQGKESRVRATIDFF